jgi:hypothetical protein
MKITFVNFGFVMSNSLVIQLGWNCDKINLFIKRKWLNNFDKSQLRDSRIQMHIT